MVDYKQQEGDEKFVIRAKSFTFFSVIIVSLCGENKRKLMSVIMPVTP